LRANGISFGAPAQPGQVILPLSPMKSEPFAPLPGTFPSNSSAAGSRPASHHDSLHAGMSPRAGNS
jgi:hypothetical protein